MDWHMPRAKSACIMIEVEPADHNGIRKRQQAQELVSQKMQLCACASISVRHGD